MEKERGKEKPEKKKREEKIYFLYDIIRKGDNVRKGLSECSVFMP